GAGERTHRRDHAAVVLEVVVRVEDVGLAVVDVLRRDLDAAVGALHVLRGRLAVEVAAVGVTTPLGVDLREVLVAARAAGLDDLEDARTVGAGLGPEDPRAGAPFVTVLRRVGGGVGAHVVLLLRLLEVRDERDGVVDERDDVWEGIAEEPGDAHGNVDAGPAEL